MVLLDQFYTKTEVAKYFVDKIKSVINLNEFDNVIEPSAGSGNILKYLPEHNRIGLDLEPKHPEVIEMDFFDYEFPKGKTIVVGNPPFGASSKMAIDFFNKCAKHADIICFIVPRSWLKYYTQNRLDSSFGLYYNGILADASFELDGGNDYKVKCVAQIWSKTPLNINKQWELFEPSITQEQVNQLHKYQIDNDCYGDDNNIRIINKLPTTHPDFKIKMPPYKHLNMPNVDWEYLAKWGYDYDFAIIGTSGRIVNTDDFSTRQQRWYVKGGDRKLFNKLNLRSLDWCAIGNFGGFNSASLVYAYKNKIYK